MTVAGPIRQPDRVRLAVGEGEEGEAVGRAIVLKKQPRKLRRTAARVDGGGPPCGAHRAEVDVVGDVDDQQLRDLPQEMRRQLGPVDPFCSLRLAIPGEHIADGVLHVVMAKESSHRIKYLRAVIRLLIGFCNICVGHDCSK